MSQKATEKIFFEKRQIKGFFLSFYVHLILLAYIRPAISKDFLSANLQTLILLKHDKMICYKQLLFERYWVKNVFWVIRRA